MLASKIKLNQDYAVSVEYLVGPRTIKSFASREVAIGAQSSTRSPSLRPNTLRRATILETKVDRWVDSSGYSRTSKVKKDGILVAFTEPVVLANGNKVFQAVVSAKYVAMSWDEHTDHVESAAKAAADRVVRNREAADAFAARLEQFQSNLAAIGIRTSLHNDVSGIHGNGVAVSLNSAVVDGERVAVGYGDTRMTTVDRNLFEQLVAIAAKHGEVVASA